eukprot:gene20742-27561_t
MGDPAQQKPGPIQLGPALWHTQKQRVTKGAPAQQKPGPSQLGPAFFLAHHEFLDLAKPFDWDLLPWYGDRLHIVCCPNDIWMSGEQYRKMRDELPSVQVGELFFASRIFTFKDGSPYVLKIRGKNHSNPKPDQARPTATTSQTKPDQATQARPSQTHSHPKPPKQDQATPSQTHSNPKPD